ncbi:hypothetical protein [Bdellovibrio sp. HCB-162]|uniref:hypothetical protein n=1 Tax=Bdellovibrio sp. HCB-162 TaxID=3394234 RepID=UPI0039BCDDA7
MQVNMTFLPDHVRFKPIATKDGIQSLNQFVRWEDIVSAKLKGVCIRVKRKNVWSSFLVPVPPDDYLRVKSQVLAFAPKGNPLREIFDSLEGPPEYQRINKVGLVSGIVIIIIGLILFYIVSYAGEPVNIEKMKPTLRLADVPTEILTSCRDGYGKIADIGEEAEISDVHMNNKPRAKLLLVCKHEDQAIEVFCIKGSYSPSIVHVRATKRNGKWIVNDNTKQPSHTVNVKCSQS